MRDFYLVLGIARSATCAEVRTAYRRQALLKHPDKGGAAEEFRLVVEAFEVLGDGSRRAEYDCANPSFGITGGKGCGSHSMCAGGKDMQSSRAGLVTSKVIRAGKRKHRTARCQADGVGHPVSKPCFRTASDSASASVSMPKAPPCFEAGVPEPAREPSGDPGAGHTGATDCAKRGSETSGDVSDLVKSLFGLNSRELDSRLQELPEGTLRQYAKIIQEWASEQQDDDVSTIAVHADVCLEDKAANSWGPAHGADSGNASSSRIFSTSRPSETTPVLSICDAQPDGSDSPAQEKALIDDGVRPKKARNRGVSKSLGRFYASVGIECMRLCSNHVATVDAAIDFHIRLVHIRQLVRIKMQQGHPFPDALRACVARDQSQSAQEGLPRMKVNYRIQIRTKNRRMQPGTSNLDEAVSLWQDLVADVSRRRAAIKQVRAMKRSLLELARQKRAEAKRKRFEEKQLRLAERKRLAEQRRRRQRQKNRQVYADKCRNILARVLAALQRLERNRQKLLYKRWGVRNVPLGLEFSTLDDQDDCVRALINLADGSVAQGPLRSSLRQAKNDLKDLSALQRAGGDDVVRAELERRDAEAMASLFTERLS